MVFPPVGNRGAIQADKRFKPLAVKKRQIN